MRGKALQSKQIDEQPPHHNRGDARGWRTFPMLRNHQTLLYLLPRFDRHYFKD